MAMQTMSDPDTEIEEQIVVVVDDDPDARESLEFLIRSVGLPIRTYSTAAEFLESGDAQRPGVLILDMRMPGMSGLELQERLNEMQIEKPIILLTGHAEVPLAVKAMRSGAIDVIQKPYSQQVLLDRIQQGLEDDRIKQKRKRQISEARQLMGLLTAGEREVLIRLRDGKSNKEIANDLGLTRRGIEARRANIMRKLRAESLADLLRLSMTSEETRG